MYRFSLLTFETLKFLQLKTCTKRSPRFKFSAISIYIYPIIHTSKNIHTYFDRYDRCSTALVARRSVLKIDTHT